MDDPNLLNDVRFLRDVVERTQPPAVNRDWPATLGWGCVVTIAYVAYALLRMAGKVALLPWVWPVLIFLVGFPLNWYLARKVRLGIEERGVRPRFRKDLMCLWISITAMGMLWTAGLGISGNMASHWYVLSFLWCSLYFVGYVMNGVLLSKEWFWAAGVMLASLIIAFLAGPDFYWLPGLWIGGTGILAGLLGRRNARLHPVEV
jgi:hypothetical protein